jgi:hypothetical protein
MSMCFVVTHSSLRIINRNMMKYFFVVNHGGKF